MANIRSAKKRIRRIQKQTEVNRDRRSRVRAFIRKAERAIESGDSSAARQAVTQAEPELMRGVTKGIIHANTAARKLSRLHARIKSLSS